MRARIVTIAVLTLVAGVAAFGLVLLGRSTAGAHASYQRGYRAGTSAGHLDGYFAGLRAGQAEGLRTGRVLQAGADAPADERGAVRDAFGAGYTAGSNDAFGGYDGGWGMAAPYVIVLQPGSGPIVYRISSRLPMAAGTNYYLCADRHSVCHQPRR